MFNFNRILKCFLSFVFCLILCNNFVHSYSSYILKKSKNFEQEFNVRANHCDNGCFVCIDFSTLNDIDGFCSILAQKLGFHECCWNHAYLMLLLKELSWLKKDFVSLFLKNLGEYKGDKDDVKFIIKKFKDNLIPFYEKMEDESALGKSFVIYYCY